MREETLHSSMSEEANSNKNDILKSELGYKYDGKQTIKQYLTKFSLTDNYTKEHTGTHLFKEALSRSNTSFCALVGLLLTKLNHYFLNIYFLAIQTDTKIGDTAPLNAIQFIFSVIGLLL